MLLDKLRNLLDKREISVRELADLYINRIDKYNGDLNAFLYVNKDKIGAAAAVAQARIDAGRQAPLTGIPVALSDNICAKDMPMTCASRILDGYRPPYDAAAVEKLRRQDALLLGKLNIGEFGMGASTDSSYYGPSKNPFDLNYAPAGAAGGAGAAVAAGLCAAAVGADAGGAVGRSASSCGVSGFRPSFGNVSRHGLAAYASCFDQAGVVAAGADDCAVILDAISGRCPKDPLTSVYERGADAAFAAGNNAGIRPSGADLKGVRIGLIRELFGGKAGAQISDAVYEAAKRFERAGAVVTEVSIPMLEYGAAAFMIIACAEASANLARIDGIRYGRRSDCAGDYYEIVAKSRGEGFGPEVRRQIMFGTYALSKDNYEKYYKKAVSIVGVIKAQYFAALQNVDLLISPAAFSAVPLQALTAVSPQALIAVSANAPHVDADYLSSAESVADKWSVGPSLAGLPSVSAACGYLPSDGTVQSAGLTNGIPAGFTNGIPAGPLNGIPAGLTNKFSAGLPIGLTITGRRFEDYKLLDIAGADAVLPAPPVLESI